MPSSYVDLGDCIYTCKYCHAYFWPGESVAPASAHDGPAYHRCCRDGKVRLPASKSPPSLFVALFVDAHFLENIRRYNSVFSMTSFGANVDEAVNDGRGPYVFWVEGQICHRIGCLCPPPDRPPSFAQLYVYDTLNELGNRLSIFLDNGVPVLRPDIIAGVLAVLEGCNELVRLFRIARDLHLYSEITDFGICLFNSRKEVRYDRPAAGSIGAIVCGGDSEVSEFDIVVWLKDGNARRISNLHPSYMSLQYPLLFPYGESGWSTEMKLSTNQRDKDLSMNMYYCYQIHDRPFVYSLLLRGGRLFQQYIVDAYVSIEYSRLDYHRKNQSKFRNELLQGVHDAIQRGDSEGREVGRRTYLPSSFTGGPRYMYKHYQDALAICRAHGNPQFFITFTCNAKWPEIRRYMSAFPHLQPQDRPDIIARVFQMKVKSLVAYLKEAEPFGYVTAYVYTIEFQKRGLPHCHLLLWVTDRHKVRGPEDIDRHISAEIPDPVLEPELYKIVTETMIHGPCGYVNPGSPCMEGGKCTKDFPKDYREATSLDKNGYAFYRRRSGGHTVTRNGIRIDNGFVVPYNRLLCLRFAAHINVEYCGWSMLIKYLFKYISKGTDRIRFAVRSCRSAVGGSSQETVQVDEINSYLDGRFICPHEAAWRILNFNIHVREPSVQILCVHLENMQNVTFTDDDSLEYVVRNPYLQSTTLTGWLYNNRIDPSGHHLRYVDFMKEYRWDGDSKCWIRRTRARNPTVGRLAYIHPTCGEAFYLRMLLTHQRGCCSFSDIRTVEGHQYQTFREACQALGLLDNNREWMLTFEDAAVWATARELRSLYIHMLLYCEVSNPLEIWQSHWSDMADDIVYAHGLKNDEDVRQHVLYELELLLKTNGSSASKSIAHYGLPLPRPDLQAILENKLLMEEKNYDRQALKVEHDGLFANLHPDQLVIYNLIINSIQAQQQVLMFVYGHGGTGKTYLWSAVISRLRSEGKIVLAVAASGIASLLLPSGRTSHSRFRIPLNLTEKSLCNIKKGTQLSRLIEQTLLVIWDEAPMSERYSLEALDRTLKDILGAPSEPFGGMSIVLGGDFRQTLPIKQKATRAETISLSLPCSPLWRLFRMCSLTVNMRLQKPNLDPVAKAKISEFSTWLIDIGNGVIGVPDPYDLQNAKKVEVPQEFIIPYSVTALAELIDFIYDEDTLQHPTATNLSKKAIVCPRNDTVDEVNNIVLAKNNNLSKVYLSVDSVSSHGNVDADNDLLYPAEYLNSLSFTGIPPHHLELKVNSPVILLRNINQSLGLCNGTRLIVTQLLANVIEARIITGVAIGRRVYIPRITLTHSDEQLPFTFRRKQFPLKLCYAMTINKSQGQSLNKIGIYLPEPVFSHGQLYVAFSRATSPDALKVLIVPEGDDPPNVTKNIVYLDFLQSV